MSKGIQIKFKKTGFYKCLACGGTGTAQTIHCGENMTFVPPTKKAEKGQTEHE